MKEELSTGKVYCLVSAIIIFGSYIIQRIINNTIVQTRHLVILEALAFTAITALVIFLIAKSKEAYYGILMAIFGIRMLPIEITNLAEFSKLSELMYFLVDRASLLIFVLIIISLYRSQPEPKQINAIPIIAIICIVPFFNQIQAQVYDYLVSVSNGNMIMAYFSGYAIYSVAMIALLFVAVRSNNIGARMICDFQLVALLLNIGRRVCSVVICMFKGHHISGSYYGWILVGIVFFIIFYFVRKNSLKEQV